MAGPVGRSFVQAIEWTMAHSIVQLASNQPKYLILFLCHGAEDRARPFIMVSKYESDISDQQFKVRVWESELNPWEAHWSWLEFVFCNASRVAGFVANYHTPEPCRTLSMGCKTYTEWPNGPDVHGLSRNDLDNHTGVMSWLTTSDYMFSEYLDEYVGGGDAMTDVEAVAEWVENEANLCVLLEEQIDMLIRLTFP